MDDRRRIYYCVLNPASPDPARGDLDVNDWNENPTRVSFPREILDAGYAITGGTVMPTVKLGARSEDSSGLLLPEELDPFASTTARLTASAPFHALSDGTFLCVFQRQGHARRARHGRTEVLRIEAEILGKQANSDGLDLPPAAMQRLREQAQGALKAAAAAPERLPDIAGRDGEAESLARLLFPELAHAREAMVQRDPFTVGVLIDGKLGADLVLGGGFGVCVSRGGAALAQRQSARLRGRSLCDT
ncbi:MAG: hypothetical protein JNJ46_21580 [Myxococcales bacterium]|nr:hypothetical protein [Myxococcales bacterium]